MQMLCTLGKCRTVPVVSVVETCVIESSRQDIVRDELRFDFSMAQVLEPAEARGAHLEHCGLDRSIRSMDVYGRLRKND